MTIAQAIAKATEAVPNTIEQKALVEWLSRVDWQVKKEILDNYTDEIEYNGYDGSDTSITLLVEPPYDELYIRYLEAMIRRNYDELVKYNNAISEYNAIFHQYQAQYNRTHTPKGEHRFKFYGGM